MTGAREEKSKGGVNNRRGEQAIRLDTEVDR